MAVDAALVEAVSAVWRLRRPGPDNLLSAPPFVALSDLCEARYGGGKAVFALSNALRSLGLPCGLRAAQADLALDPTAAAVALDAAFLRKQVRRRHLCPLDLADTLPILAFGDARVARFSAPVLGELFDAPRLARVYPGVPFELNRLSMFHWLVIEEEVEVDPRPEARSTPIFFTDMSRDFGEIEPHLGRFPPAVESALFFLLLAAWEDWAGMPEVDWRGFRAPWIYTTDDDLFVRPPRPPNPDSLSLEDQTFTDPWGEEVEMEVTTTLPMEPEAQAALVTFNEDLWAKTQAALATPLFETPVVHFLVRAFLADGMDEVMAHMTAIEAAVGLESDHRRKLRPKPDPYKNFYASDCVAARLGAALGQAKAVQDYKDLFELRSGFVHGRAGLEKIKTPQRLLARSLARGVARALVDLAAQPSRPREETLAELLDRGTKL